MARSVRSSTTPNCHLQTRACHPASDKSSYQAHLVTLLCKSLNLKPLFAEPENDTPVGAVLPPSLHPRLPQSLRPGLPRSLHLGLTSHRDIPAQSVRPCTQQALPGRWCPSSPPAESRELSAVTACALDRWTTGLRGPALRLDTPPRGAKTDSL